MLQLHFALLCMVITHCNAVTNITFNDKLTIWLYSTNIVRITTLPDTIIKRPKSTSRIVTYEPEPVFYNISNPNSSTALISTSDIIINVNKNTNMVTFYDPNDLNNAVLSEYNKTFLQITDTATNLPTYSILQEWLTSSSTKSLFGWGQYQNGFTNYYDSTVRCVQFNTEACVPMIITNSFFGIYWDNLGVSTLNSINTQIEPSNINIVFDNNSINYAEPIYGMAKQKNIQATWQNLTFPFTASNINGYRSFFSYFDNWHTFGASKSCDVYIEFIVERLNGNKQIIDLFNYTYNLPSSLAMKPFYMTSNEKVTIYINYQCLNSNNMPLIYYREPSNYIDIKSNEAFYIDYYFIYSPPNSYAYKSPVNQQSLDGIIAGYRLLTEASPLYELSNYGFWYTKQHYNNQQQVLYDATEYRQRGLPVDAAILEYYWGSNEYWGPQWDMQQYPNPAAMVQKLHDMNFYFMVSVWSEFGTNSTCYKYLKSQSNATNNTEFIPNSSTNIGPWIDPFNKQSQKDLYQCIKSTMFDIGVDAIWSDVTEPEFFPNYNELYDNGKYSVNALFGPYSLQIVESIQQGLNIDQPNKRPFDLTRSSFSGQSKTGSTLWSGDTTSNYDTFRRQISAGIGFSLSGNPYWTMDIGGFYRPSCNYVCWWYLQLLIRWFQYGAFVPIFRVHGAGVNTTYWSYGPVVENYVKLVDNLRYRLLPYIYSTAYYITKYGYTMQRGLIFDFFNDTNVYNISQQFMFGPYMLVSPVYNYDNTTNIYLPNKYNIWYDFWSGEEVKGGTYMKNKVIPLNIIPLYIHDGSIIIMAPFSQYANQYYPWNELEVRIYSGSNATFIYYNDDGKDRFSLKNNKFITITFNWNDQQKQLIIYDRNGEYNGMIKQITLNLVIVTAGHGIGVNITKNVDKSVIYNGSKMIVNF